MTKKLELIKLKKTYIFNSLLHVKNIYTYRNSNIKIHISRISTVIAY